MLISLSLIAVASCQVTIEGGQCTPVPFMPEFDLKRYAGLWHEQIKYPFRSPDGKCITAEYTRINDTSVIVNNTVITTDDNGQWYFKETPGTAVQTEPEISGNKLYVKFDNRPPETCAPGEICADGVYKSNYLVLDTDYENYTMVEMFWIMSRSQDFRKTEKYEKVVQRAVEKFGFIRELAIETIQEDCEFDYYLNDPPNNVALYPALSFQLLIFICYISSQFGY